MGGFALPAVPALAEIQTGLMGLGLVQGIANSRNAGAQAEAQARAQAQAVAAQAAQQRELLDRQYASDTRKRQNLLERATARARVSFGARGLSPTDGSAAALVDGLETDFGFEEAERAGDYALRRGGLDRGLADSLQRIDSGRARNLLDAENDVQRRIQGLLNWGVGTAGKRGTPAPFQLRNVEAQFEDYAPFA
jgi:hypothetical protein